MKRRNLRLGSLPTNYRENAGDGGRRGARARAQGDEEEEGGQGGGRESCREIKILRKVFWKR